MDWRSVFFYPGEEIGVRPALRFIHLILWTFLTVMVLSEMPLLVAFTVIPAVYWIPVVQERFPVSGIRNYLLASMIYLSLPIGLLFTLLLGSPGVVVFFLPGLIFISILIYGNREWLKPHLRSFWEYMGGKNVMRKTGIGLVLLVSLVILAGLGTVLYINSMADPVNQDAEYPEKEFERLYSDVNPNETGITVKSDLDELEGQRLDRRLKVAGIGQLDAAFATGDRVMGALQKPDPSTPPPEYMGNTILLCSNHVSEAHITCRRDTSYSTVYSRMYKGWLLMGADMGSLENLYRNDTARTVFLDYVKRAEFYDSYLNPEGFEIKPLEAVIYTSRSGLHVIGKSNEPVYVDGEKVPQQDREEWTYANISLERGHHTVSRENMSVELPVYRPVGFGKEYNKDRFVVGTVRNNSFDFDRAVLRGREKTRYMELRGNSTSLNISYSPRNITLMEDGFNVTLTTGYVNNTRPQGGEAFGMTEDEYRRFKWLIERTGVPAASFETY